jgi:signal transduction protein with GAF and PtsI domain
MALRRVAFASKEAAEAADRRLGSDGHLDPTTAEEISATEIQKLPAAVLPEATYLRKPGQRVVAGKEEEGWSLVELVDHVPADPSPFEDVRERVRDDLTALRALERVSTRVEERRAQAKVEVDESALRDQAAFAALQRAAGAESPLRPPRDRVSR